MQHFILCYCSTSHNLPFVQSTQPVKMTTRTEIKSAIARSISHNEIVLLVVDSSSEALEAIDNDENVTELDWSDRNNGDIDAWGGYAGEDFRLHIRCHQCLSAEGC